MTIGAGLLVGLGVPVYTTDSEGYITAFSREAADLWGREPDLGIDRWSGALRLFDAGGNSLSLSDTPIAVALRENRAVENSELMLERPDGTLRWYVSNPTRLLGDSGELIGAVNVMFDITARKAAEEAGAYLNAIITSSDDAIVSKNLDGIVTSWNESAERIFGFTRDDMIGKSIRQIIPADRQAEEDEVLARIRRGDRVDHYETVRRRKDGSFVPVSLTVSPVRDPDGRIIGASKVARDVSERQESDRKLAEALAVKDEFIGLVSHELRTPLTTILGNAAILSRRENILSEDARFAAARDIQVEAERLNRIVEDLLAFARMEHGVADVEPASLLREVDRIVAEFRSKSSRAVEYRIDTTPPIVAGDEGVIRHVMANYLSNAVKYSPAGSPIEVIVDRLHDHGRVRVLDRGIGIESNEAERIFEPFYRSKNVGRVGGVGIGLSVCRHLLSAVGGECWAAPRLGGGSEFGFLLPAYVSSDADA